jgi:hypothetical protein
MKLISLSATLMLLGCLTLTIAQTNLDTQIDAVKNAPSQKRVELMNEFKQKLIKMNTKRRIEAIKKLRSKIKMTQQETHQDHMIDNHIQTHERSGMEQMKESRQMQEIEHMNQYKVADQYIEYNEIHNIEGGDLPIGIENYTNEQNIQIDQIQ